MSSLPGEIQRFGATEEQLVDLEQSGPRSLRFADLVRAPEADRAPVVVESQGRPLIYVFDARPEIASETFHRWLRRIAFRGDADWVGVLRPGRLDIHPAVLDREIAPLPIQDLPQDVFRIPALVHRPGIEAPSVRSRLRSLLFASIQRARRAFKLHARDALALVGGALFWRFLVDRNLLDGLDPATIAPGAESWTGCLDTKQRALATFGWIDRTFNGGLLEFETPRRDLPAEVFAKVAGDIAHKTDEYGQLSLPEKWAQIDFAHVPVGLLSEVYEAVAHDRDEEEATEKSLFFTPRHLAEYIVDEVLDALGDVERPQLLDPAAGAGVFLVAAFRALVAREWKRIGKRPSRKMVRRVLNEQLVGFDIDGDALRLAELALYLTAIELDPEDRPRPVDVLGFAALRGEVLVHKNHGARLGSLGPVSKEHRGRFDAIFGNPPWTALKKGKVEKWADISRAMVEQRLGEKRAAAFEFPDANPDLPFVYRAMEWGKPEAVIGLLTHARWLFGQSASATRARRDLLESVHVTGILNGTALRKTKVWPNVAPPFCIVFARNELPPTKAAFQFVSPELDLADFSQDRIRIDWSDAAVVEVQQVVERPWTLKARFRGTPIDEAVLDDLLRAGIPLGDYLASLGTGLRDGFIKAPNQPQEDASELVGLPLLTGKTRLGFVVDPQRLKLEAFSGSTLHRPRGKAQFEGPLLLLRESLPVDPLKPRSLRSVEDVLFSQSFHGASFAQVPTGLRIVEYLQLLLQSDLARHHALLTDAHFGIEREQVHLETSEGFPVVPYAELTTRQKATAHDLAVALETGLDSTLAERINSYVARIYRLTNVQQQAILDAMATALPTRTAQKTALHPTTAVQRAEFGRVCERSLREVLSASQLTAHVQVREDLAESVWCFVQIDRVPLGEMPREQVTLPISEFLQAADQGAASLVFLRVDEGTTLVGMLDRYRYWTRTRARLLASTLLAGSEV